MNNHCIRAILASTALCFAAAAMGQSSTGTPADNSKSNKLDPANTSASADAQKDNAMDRSLTQRIRQSVMADKTLSTYAHNVKIVSVNGTVTLNGVVRSEQEKSTVAAKAMEVAGDGKVVNDLKVSPKS